MYDNDNGKKDYDRVLSGGRTVKRFLKSLPRMEHFSVARNIYSVIVGRFCIKLTS